MECMGASGLASLSCQTDSRRHFNSAFRAVCAPWYVRSVLCILHGAWMPLSADALEPYLIVYSMVHGCQSE